MFCLKNTITNRLPASGRCVLHLVIWTPFFHGLPQYSTPPLLLDLWFTSCILLILFIYYIHISLYIYAYFYLLFYIYYFTYILFTTYFTRKFCMKYPIVIKLFEENCRCLHASTCSLEVSNKINDICVRNVSV